MRNFIFVLFIFTLICPISYAQDESKLSLSLSRMEREWLHREFNNENDEIRISRLEENVFGTIHDIDLKSRYSQLLRAFNLRKSTKEKTSRDYLFGTPTSIPMNVDELIN